MFNKFAVISKMFKFKKLLGCGKVMFLHLSVILFMGGGLSRGLCRGVSIQAGLCSKGASVQRGLCSGWWVSVEGALSGKLPKRLRAAGTHPTGVHSCYRHC